MDLDVVYWGLWQQLLFVSSVTMMMMLVYGDIALVLLKEISIPAMPSWFLMETMEIILHIHIIHPMETSLV